MPQYEYICEADGATITLLRSMKDADALVEDPAGKGRTFVRMHSTFMVGETSRASSYTPRAGGGCPCAEPNGCWS